MKIVRYAPYIFVGLIVVLVALLVAEIAMADEVPVLSVIARSEAIGMR